jgi:hypothetical protein
MSLMLAYGESRLVCCRQDVVKNKMAKIERVFFIVGYYRFVFKYLVAKNIKNMLPNANTNKLSRKE